LAQKIRRSDAVGDEALAAARGGERQALADRRRPQPGQGHAAGCAVKKALKPARKRKLVDAIKTDWKVSIRRACAVLKIDRSVYVYKSRCGEQAELKLRIQDICQTRVRYGYRRIHMLLKRDGWLVNSVRARVVAPGDCMSGSGPARSFARLTVLPARFRTLATATN